MDFKTNKPIYLQIVDFCFRKILTAEWTEGERVPSIRELATELQVNPNTAMRSFEYMTLEDVIFSERGKGYFVSQTAKNKILVIRKKDFFTETLPEFFTQIKLLGISMNEVVEYYNNQIKS